MKVKLFSHTDLDGYGCNIIMRSIFGDNVDCTNINYDKIDEEIKQYIFSEEYKNYACTYITDISVNEEIAKLIDDRINTTGVKFVLLDHHPTALELNKYKWAEVKIENDEEKTSGTRMLYDELSEAVNILNDENYLHSECLFDLVESVRKYDTWLWKEKYNDAKPKKLNDLFYLLGKERFTDKIIKYIALGSFKVKDFIEDNHLLLELQQEKIDKYVESKNKEIIEYNLNGCKVGVVFAEQFQSELGNRLSELNPQYDLIAMIGDKTISYRTIHEDINCGFIASWFGGGGHPKASGSQINKDNKIKYIEELFKISK